MASNHGREELRRKILETRSHRVTMNSDDNIIVNAFSHSPPPPPPPPPPSPASSTSSSSSQSSYSRQPFRVTHSKSSPSSFFPANAHDPDQHISASPLHHLVNADHEGVDDASDSTSWKHETSDEDVSEENNFDDMMKVLPSLDASKLQRISIDREPLQLSPNK